MASWEYVGIGAGTTVSSGNATPTEPAGAASGDLLVCVISYRGSAAFTAPSGWTIVEQESSGNTDVDVSTSIASGLIAYIVRGASAPSYVFTRTGGDVAIPRVTAYRPVGGTITFDESNSATLGTAGTTVSMTGFTTNDANSLIVVGACGASNSTATDFDAATDPTTGSGSGSSTATGAIAAGTWRRRNSTGTTTGADTNISIADAVRATAGATGDIQYTAAASRRHVIVGAAFTITSTGATLTADAGSFALTGIAAGTTASRLLTASAGSFAHTGNPAAFIRGQNLPASGEAFTLTGSATGFGLTRLLIASAGSFTHTGIAAGTPASRLLTAADRSFTLTGNSAALIPSGQNVLIASVGAFALTGVDAGLKISRVLTASAGVFALVSPAADLAFPSDPTATFISLGTAAPTLVHLVTIDALGIRWTDGGFVLWRGNVYASEDTTYGWLGGIGAIEDGADGQATVCDLTIICDETALALWVDPTVQGSIVTIHLGTLNRDTGRLIGEPNLLFRGELDQPRLSAGAGLTLIFDCITEEARMLEPNEEQRMTDSFHQSVWPSDLGCEHITDVEKKIYWRANDPSNAIS